MKISALFQMILTFALCTCIIAILQYKYTIVIMCSGNWWYSNFRVGDLILASPSDSHNLKLHDIILVQLPNISFISTRRIIKVEYQEELNQYLYLTKHDYNTNDDTLLYGNNMTRITSSHILGKVELVIPLVGYAEILFYNYPLLRYSLFILFTLRRNYILAFFTISFGMFFTFAV